jgi:invasion protein IalB
MPRAGWCGLVLLLSALSSVSGLAESSSQIDPDHLSPLVYTPWTKLCELRETVLGPRTCFTTKRGRTMSGEVVVAASVVQRHNKLPTLRVALPLGIHLIAAVRVTIDDAALQNGALFECNMAYCTTEYRITDELLQRVRTGRDLVIESGQWTATMSLVKFAVANDGPPEAVEKFEPQSSKPGTGTRGLLHDDTLAPRYRPGGQY